MRIGQKKKTGYLPAFQYMGNVTVEPELADDFVQAPPEVLFMYHTWKRLVGDYYYPRKIDKEKFLAFLNEDQQWKPEYWKAAPKEYVEMLKGRWDQDKLPLEVKQAFIGWMNYTYEGEAIDNVKPTYGELKAFLLRYPHFQRSYWINLLKPSKPYYLSRMDRPDGEIVADDQMSGLLKMALYNYSFSAATKPSS